eukprot:478467-Rhodomonas_salina.5
MATDLSTAGTEAAEGHCSKVSWIGAQRPDRHRGCPEMGRDDVRKQGRKREPGPFHSGWHNDRGLPDYCPTEVGQGTNEILW